MSRNVTEFAWLLSLRISAQIRLALRQCELAHPVHIL